MTGYEDVFFHGALCGDGSGTAHGLRGVLLQRKQRLSARRAGDAFSAF